jgi:16S rRNA (uracil1498-N3)-methyltransferase
LNLQSLRADCATLSPEEARHASQVLRLTPGTSVELLDGMGGLYRAELVQVSKAGVVARIEAELPNAEPRTRVTLYQGVAKGEKMDWIVQKAVELGAFRIQPVCFARCVAQGQHKAERWQRIALEAAKQCGRGRIPKVEEPLPLQAALESLARHEQCLVPWEEERSAALSGLLRPDALDIGLIIGPEGGLDPAEMDMLSTCGAVSVTLGPRILRTETAAVAALTMVLAAMGDMGCRP